MAQCDMCGEQGTQLKALIEGVQMDVCRTCAAFGMVLHRPVGVQPHNRQLVQQAKQEPVERVIETAGELIKAYREKFKLTQDELALKLAEKSSLLNKMEAGKMLPNLAIARKLERFFDIVLVEKAQESDDVNPRSKPSQFTIGDMLTQKQQQKQV